MEHKEYNGYTNYETWLVNLRIVNDQGEQGYWIEQTEDADDVQELERQFQNYYEDEVRPELNGMFNDLMQSALAEVNWQEIAENYWEEYKPKEDAKGEY